MPVIYSNNASTTLSAGINDSTTTIAIASNSGFPSIGSNEYYFATIANTNNTKIEVVKVTAGTTSLTVTRAQDSTTAQAFDSGDNFQLRVTAATLSAATKTDVNITGGAIAGAAITNDVIDSQHYADGSIDHAHLSNDCIDGDNIQDDAIESEHYADGSIDTAHIADDAVDADKLANSINSAIAANTAKVTNATHTGEVTGATALTIADDVVDEANLKISNAGSNGQFLSKQSGNTGGLTWADAGGAIPSGTVMAFFQSGAPTGWTQVTSQNDKMLRVVSGTGGGTGGSAAVSSPAHNIAAAAHTLATSEMPAHTHGSVGTSLGTSSIRAGGNGNWYSLGTSLSTGSSGSTGGGGSHSHNTSGSITTPQYIDVIICSKDA